ncbi:DUF6204 family protein [Streptomyces chiangmaiensis]
MPQHRTPRAFRQTLPATALAAHPAFTFRFLDSGEAEEDILTATERAEESARAWLDARGYGYKNLRAKAEDLSRAPLGKRRRRATGQSSS